jgi:hypothetical protein
LSEYKALRSLFFIYQFGTCLLLFFFENSTQAARRGRQYQFAAQKKMLDIIYRLVPKDKRFFYVIAKLPALMPGSWQVVVTSAGVPRH